MISWSYRDQSRQLVDYLGQGSVGTLTYTSGGHMSVQIMKGGRRKFDSGELMGGSPEEIDEAFRTFFAYFGSFEEKEPGLLAHHIIGSNFPNWVDTTELRQAKFEGDNLLLTAPGVLPDGEEVKFEIRWEKVA